MRTSILWAPLLVRVRSLLFFFVICPHARRCAVAFPALLDVSYCRLYVYFTLPLSWPAARPCIAKRAVEIAQKEGCKFVAHGATGKGNDQVRFELTFAALDPTLQSVVPWRDPTFYNRFRGRSDLLDYAASKGLPVVQTKAKPYSMDENMFHISYEAGILEDPSASAPADMFRMTVDPRRAPDVQAEVTLTFDKGLPVRVQNAADSTG